MKLCQSRLSKRDLQKLKKRKLLRRKKSRPREINLSQTNLLSLNLHRVRSILTHSNMTLLKTTKSPISTLSNKGEL